MRNDRFFVTTLFLSIHRCQEKAFAYYHSSSQLAFKLWYMVQLVLEFPVRTSKISNTPTPWLTLLVEKVALTKNYVKQVKKINEDWESFEKSCL